MNGALTLAIPCRADEPGLEGTLESLFAACQHSELPAGLVVELVVCINGLRNGDGCLPLTVVRDFCAHHEMPIKEMWLESAAPPEGEGRRGGSLTCTVLLTEQLGKPRAWNAIWRWARGPAVLFCDADVRIEKEAVYQLYARLQCDAHLCLVAAREVPVLQPGGTLWSRVGAIPYRFDFGNAGGRLYLICKEALSGEIPEDLLLEDAWLTVAVGKHRVAKEPNAQVFFLPPATCHDYFAERVRTEGGKLQIRRMHRALLAEGPIARYRWSQLWQGIALSEYPLVLLALGLRGLAWVWVRLALTRKDFYSLYRPFSSTKGWASVRR